MWIYIHARLALSRQERLRVLLITCSLQSLLNYHTGRHQNGRHQTGHHQNGCHQTGRHQNGRHQNGQHQTGCATGFSVRLSNKVVS